MAWVRTAVACFAVALPLTGCVARQQAKDSVPPPYERVTTSNYDAVVLYRRGEACRRVVAEVEERLADWVAAEVGKFSDFQRSQWSVSKILALRFYKRQYLIPNEGTEVYVQLIHRSTDFVTSGRWLRSQIAVRGGGDNYISLQYDLQSRELTHFSVNENR